MALYTLTKKLWLTKDRQRAVEDGDPAAAFLLGPVGAEIPLPEAERLGLTGTIAAKAIKQPEVEDKGVRPLRDRGR